MDKKSNKMKLLNGYALNMRVHGYIEKASGHLTANPSSYQKTPLYTRLSGDILRTSDTVFHYRITIFLVTNPLKKKSL